MGAVKKRKAKPRLTAQERETERKIAEIKRKEDEKKRQQQARKVRSEALFDSQQRLADMFEREAPIIALDKGRELVAEGDPAKHAFMVLVGEVKIMRPGVEGTDIFLNTIGAAGLVGEMAVFEPEPTRSATVVAGVDSLIAKIRLPVFRKIMEANGSLATRIAQTLSDRLRETNQRLFESYSYSLPIRVHMALSRMAERDGIDLSEVDTFEVSLGTKADFAETLNGSREAVTRAMTKLKQNGWIESLDDTATRYRVFVCDSFELELLEKPRAASLV